MASAFFGLVEHLAMVMEADREFVLETVGEVARLPSNFLCAPRDEIQLKKNWHEKPIEIPFGLYGASHL